MMARDDRQPIIVADAGPLIRLAAAGLLDTLHGLNRQAYADAKVATLFLDSEFSVTLMTTRAFAGTVVERGINADAVATLEGISGQFNLTPASVATYQAETPADIRMPQPRDK